MKKTEFYQPTGEVIENISIDQMKKYVIDEFIEYWKQGSGDGCINYYVEDSKKVTMMIGPNDEYGIYLHYIDVGNNKTWLSLKDPSRLGEVAETAEEIYASIGLFLPIEVAWEGIKEFLLTGKRCEKIDWVQPNVIPENGNY